MTPQRIREAAQILGELGNGKMANELESLADQMAQSRDWQPIATAPNNIDPLLIYENGAMAVAVRIADGPIYSDGQTKGVYDDVLEWLPTHWMELPDPPKEPSARPDGPERTPPAELEPRSGVSVTPTDGEMLTYLDTVCRDNVRGTDCPKWCIEGEEGQTLREAIRYAMRREGQG